MDPGGFADGYANLLRDQVPSYRVLETEHAEIGGERALVRTVSGSSARRSRSCTPGVLRMRTQFGYAIVATADEDGFAAAEPVFREALAGFCFDEDAA